MEEEGDGQRLPVEATAAVDDHHRAEDREPEHDLVELRRMHGERGARPEGHALGMRREVVEVGGRADERAALLDAREGPELREQARRVLGEQAPEAAAEEVAAAAHQHGRRRERRSVEVGEHEGPRPAVPREGEQGEEAGADRAEPDHPASVDGEGLAEAPHRARMHEDVGEPSPDEAREDRDEEAVADERGVAVVRSARWSERYQPARSARPRKTPYP